VSNVENVYEQFGNVSNVDVLQLANVKTQVTTQRPHIWMSIGWGFFCHQWWLSMDSVNPQMLHMHNFYRFK
jgi:hypothetical protein